MKRSYQRSLNFWLYKPEDNEIKREEASGVPENLKVYHLNHFDSLEESEAFHKAFID